MQHQCLYSTFLMPPNIPSAPFTVIASIFESETGARRYPFDYTCAKQRQQPVGLTTSDTERYSGGSKQY